MRPGTIRARRDDRLERLLVGSELVEELGHPPSELALGPADELLFGNPPIRLVGDRGRAPDLLELVLVLDRA